jgi:hypothetical protein
MLEIILRKNDRNISDKIPESLKEHLVFETSEKVVFNVKNDWIGFRDGTIIDLLRDFGESLYAAIAYFSTDDDEWVTDFDGNFIDDYDAVVDGKRVKKYVKKRVQVLKMNDKEKDSFQLKRYMLDLRATNPIILVLDAYSIGVDGGLKSNDFIGAQR